MKTRKSLQLATFLASMTLLASCGETPRTPLKTSGDLAITGKTAWDVSNASSEGVTGITSLLGISAAKKTDILGKLEDYAVQNNLAGMPLYQSDSTVMYQPRIQHGATSYVPGYGWGTLREGNLEGNLKSFNADGSVGSDVTTGVANPTFYQTSETSNPNTINYLDDSGSQVSDLHGYCQNVYFGTKLNATKNGYEYYGALSSEDHPIVLDSKTGTPLNEQTSEAVSNKFRVYLRTGGNGGVKFRTASTKTDRAAYNNKDVTIDDYVNAFKILACGKFGFYRGSELAGHTGYTAIEGIASYYNATKSANPDSETATKAWENVGIKSGHDETKGDYIDFTLGAPTTRFYAMYSLSSTLYSPINMDFFKLVTDNFENFSNYGSYSSDKSTGPVDNILSVGPFYLSNWSEQSITFTRDDNWWERLADNNVYRIPGIQITINTAAATDKNANFKEFMAGHLDAAAINSTYWDAFHNSSYGKKTKGSSFQLNINSCTKEEWVAKFGTNGSIAQTAESEYWNVKPWMSNDDFVKALNFSVDRSTLADKWHVAPSINYFDDSYMSDPENGVSYNTTSQHEEAIKSYWGDTASTYGFSLATAQASFGTAIDALIASGDVKNGDQLTIDIWWMYDYMIEEYGEPVATNIQDAFNNSPKAKSNNLTLKVNNYATAVWHDVYYKHLMVGQFDLGFGSISGNSLDPLNFMEILKSDNSSGFTLNWGPDTGVIGIDFDTDGDGKTEKWSFDALWAAADHGVVTWRGVEVPAVIMPKGKFEYDEDGDGLVITANYKTGKGLIGEKAAAGDADALKLLQDVASGDKVWTIDTQLYITDWSKNMFYAPSADAGLTVLKDEDGELSAKASVALTEAFYNGGEAAYLGLNVAQVIGQVEYDTSIEGAVDMYDWTFPA